jgi:cytoskeleton protein RodZ
VHNACTLFDIGESLAAARRGRGLELTDVEALTCIRAKQLAALETERWDEFRGRAYARAFLRTYATSLGLDANLFVEEFETRWPEEELELAPTALRRPRRLRVWPVLVGAAIVTILGVVAWRGGSGPHGVALTPAQLPAAHAASKPHAVHHAVTKSAPPALVIRAARGNCWLLVRRGSESGPTLYEGTLTRGSVARFAARPVWIRLGAPWNVDIQRGTRVLPRLPGTPTNITA